MKNQTIDPDSYPPLSPGNEKPAKNNKTFVASCMSELMKLSQSQQVEAGAHTLTVNDRWGVVFRADFKLGHESGPTPENRLVCWKDDKGKNCVMFAIGQTLTPLKP